MSRRKLFGECVAGKAVAEQQALDTIQSPAVSVEAVAGTIETDEKIIERFYDGSGRFGLLLSFFAGVGVELTGWVFTRHGHASGLSCSHLWGIEKGGRLVTGWLNVHPQSNGGNGNLTFCAKSLRVVRS